MQMPDFSSVGGLGTVALFAAGGAIATFWSQVKAFFSRISTYVVVVVAVDDYRLQQAICSFAFSKLKRSPVGKRTYGCENIFVRPVHRRENVPLERIAGESLLFWRGWRPLWVNSAGVMFIRFTWNADKLIIEANDYQNSLNSATSKTNKRFCVKNVVGKTVNGDGAKGAAVDGIHFKHVRILKWKHEHLGAPRSDVPPIQFLALSKECEHVVAEARHWRKSREWYKERGIPWKRGFLFYGKPGTGKTSLARAIAEDLDLPVYVFDLASMSNDDMYSAWTYVLQTTPCMVVFEDIDGVFEGRTNIMAEKRIGKPSLTFDCLLNCIDGMEKADGIMTIITTNNIHKLDPAIGGCPDAANGKVVPKMSTRPGRIDRIIHFEAPDAAGYRKIASRILVNAPQPVVEAVIKIGGLKKDSAVQFQDRCALIALNMYWNKKRLELRQLPSKPKAFKRFARFKKKERKENRYEVRQY